MEWNVKHQMSNSNFECQTPSRLRVLSLQDYEARFGFIFLVCATGKTAEEMLTILKVTAICMFVLVRACVRLCVCVRVRCVCVGWGGGGIVSTPLLLFVVFSRGMRFCFRSNCFSCAGTRLFPPTHPHTQHQSRMANRAELEVFVTVGEQAKITDLRLAKLLVSLASKL